MKQIKLKLLKKEKEEEYCQTQLNIKRNLIVKEILMIIYQILQQLVKEKLRVKLKNQIPTEVLVKMLLEVLTIQIRVINKLVNIQKVPKNHSQVMLSQDQLLNLNITQFFKIKNLIETLKMKDPQLIKIFQVLFIIQVVEVMH